MENNITNTLEDMALPANISNSNLPATLLLDLKHFEHLQRVAKMLSISNFVPEHYKNVSDCAIALDMAYSSGMRPLFLLQNTQVVKGNVTWKGQACIALVNTSNRFTKPLSWDLQRDKEGNVIKATCYTEDTEGNRKEASITWEMVELEGWNKNKEGRYGNVLSKWNTMREQMFCYRSATFFARLYCPDILAGMPSEGEVEDIAPIKDVTPRKSKKADTLNEMYAEMYAPKEVEPEVEPEPMGEKTVPLLSTVEGKSKDMFNHG